MTLNEVSQGEAVQVLQIHESATINRKDALRLADMGIVAGHTLRVIKRAPLGDPIQIELLGYQLCLRAAQAQFIEVSK